MKKLTGIKSNYLLFIVCSVFSILSCKKDSGSSSGGGSDYFMRFKVNGTLVEYKGQVEGTFNKSGGAQYSSGIVGLKDVFTGTKNNMTVSIATSAPTETNTTYTNYTTTAASTEKALISSLGYFDEQGNFFTSWSEEFLSGLPSGIEANSKIKVTEQTSGYLKGIFSGVIYNNDYSVKLIITDGEFYVVRKT